MSNKYFSWVLYVKFQIKTSAAFLKNVCYQYFNFVLQINYCLFFFLWAADWLTNNLFIWNVLLFSCNLISHLCPSGSSYSGRTVTDYLYYYRYLIFWEGGGVGKNSGGVSSMLPKNLALFQTKQWGHVAAALKRSYQWCLNLTPNNTETIERITCHCFLRPITRDLTSSSCTTETMWSFRPILKLEPLLT